MNTWIEKMLLRADSQAGSKGDPDACIELVNLYRDNHPLSALAFGLKARRLGCDMELGPLQAAVERLRSSEWATDPVGCYRLGAELGSYPTEAADVRKAIGFLKTAVENENAPCAGAAALNLADLLSSVGNAEAYRYFSIAEKRGFCDILPPQRTQNETAIA